MLVPGFTYTGMIQRFLEKWRIALEEIDLLLADDLPPAPVIADAGYGERFVHRTGHSIGEEVHGNGVNIDNLETKDERLLVPGICFSIEPGIYLEGEMAVRSEIDVFITSSGEVVVAGREQEELILMNV